MKICSKCNISKTENDFFFRDKKNGHRHTQCKECYKSQRSNYHAEHYRKYRSVYIERAKIRREKLRKEFRFTILQHLQGKSCVSCNENDIRVLEFDHIEAPKKSFTISQAVKLGRSVDELKSELKKCQILCSNCHKKKTAHQYNWYKSLNLEAPSGIEPL